MRIPLYQKGEMVYILEEGTPECVEIIKTSIIVEEEEVYYNVRRVSGKKEGFIIEEEDILRSNTQPPMPAFSVGDIIEFNHAVLKDENVIEWEMRTGSIECIEIQIDEGGYSVFYKTDDHKDGEYCLEDDVISILLEEVKNEVNTAATV